MTWYYCIYDQIDAALMCIRDILPTPNMNRNIIYILIFVYFLKASINKQDSEHRINWNINSIDYVILSCSSIYLKKYRELKNMNMSWLVHNPNPHLNTQDSSVCGEQGVVWLQCKHTHTHTDYYLCIFTYQHTLRESQPSKDSEKNLFWSSLNWCFPPYLNAWWSICILNAESHAVMQLHTPHTVFL